MSAPNEKEYMMVFYLSNVFIFSFSVLISHRRFLLVVTMSARKVILDNTGLKVLGQLAAGQETHMCHS